MIPILKMIITNFTSTFIRALRLISDTMFHLTSMILVFLFYLLFPFRQFQKTLYFFHFHAAVFKSFHMTNIFDSSSIYPGFTSTTIINESCTDFNGVSCPLINYDIYFKQPVLFVTQWTYYGLLRTYLANFTTFRLPLLPTQ